MGRAGRTEPGVCYHMYSKDDFDNQMKKYPKPEIKSINLSEPSLRLLNIKTINNIDNLAKVYSEFIEEPKYKFINSAIIELTQLGAIENGNITKLGSMMAELNIDPMLASSLVFSKIYKCSNEMVNLISILDTIKNNLNSLFILPKKTNDKSKKHIEKIFNDAKNKFKHKYGDHLSILNIFKEFKNTDNNKLKDWAFKHFINLSKLRTANKQSRKIRYTVNKVMPREFEINNIGLDFNENIMNQHVDDRILSCLIIGHRINTATKYDKHYKTKYSGELNVRISRNSYLNTDKNLPKDVVFSELFMSMGKIELNIVSKVPSDIAKILK